MAAAALPAARQITRPFGGGRRCADSTMSGCAAATAASKIARRRGRLSVIVLRYLAALGWDKVRTPVIHPISAKENPADAAGAMLRKGSGPRPGAAFFTMHRRAGTNGF